MTRFYTYEYLRSDWTPYYVGKGSGKRVRVGHRLSVPKDSARIRIQYWADEATAFEMEKFYIRLYGRKDNGTGILRNLTDGGDGQAGYKYTEEHRQKIRLALCGRTLSEEMKRKLSEANLGKKHTEESRRKMSEQRRGKPQSEEQIRNAAEALRGHTVTDETRSKISESHKRRHRNQVTVGVAA